VVFVQFHPEARFVLNLNLSILDDGASINYEFFPLLSGRHPANHELVGTKAGDRRGAMCGVQRAQGAADVVGANWDGIEFGQVRDLLRLEKTARIGDVDLDKVAALLHDKRLEPLPPVEIFSHEYWHRRGFRQLDP
jgi:hypothetical protein